MRVLFIVAFAFIGLGVAVSAQAQSTMPRPPRAIGALVREVCAACHGLDGNSTRTNVPSLAGQGAAYLEDQLHAFAAQGGQRANGVMGAIAVNLTADEMKGAARYFARQTLRSLAVVDVPRRDRTRIDGATLFNAGQPRRGVASCASCHGMRGQGLPDLFPRLAGQQASYLAEQLRHFRAGTRTSDPQAMMRKLAAGLTDREIDAVSNYAAGLH